MKELIEIKKGLDLANKSIIKLENDINNIRIDEDNNIDKTDVMYSFERMSDNFENIKIDVDNLIAKNDDNNLNIYQKIQKARVELQKRDLKKTGYNKFAHYKYFELGDFLPHVNEICLNIGLYTEFKYTKDQAWLYIKDTDNPDIFREWSTPIEVATLKGCSAIQNIGGTQSFARRYLYMMAFEIAETDVIDSGAVDEDAEESKRKINKAGVMTINSLIDETGVDKSKFLSWVGVEKVEDIPNSALNTCIQMLNKKKKSNESKKKEEIEIKETKIEPEEKDEKDIEDFEF